MERSLPAPPVLGTYDRCPRCHQSRDLDVPCPNCGEGDPPTLAEALRPRAGKSWIEATSLATSDEINGHSFRAGSEDCEFCGVSIRLAVARRCGA